MAEFKIPDNKKGAGQIIGIALIGLIAYFVFPILTTMMWNLTNMLWTGAIAVVSCMILLSKKFWSRLNIILSALGSALFGWIIEMNPFAILNEQLDRSEKDREELFKQAGKLKAQEASLKEQLDTESSKMQLAGKKITLCNDRIAKNSLDEDASYALESSTVEFTNSKDFIDKVGPIKSDISRLITFADKAYKKSGYALENARSTLKSQKAQYEAVTAGQSAMSKALRAFTGNPDMNKAGEIALAKLKTDIASKIGTIKNCIAETSKLMNERDLNDAAKVSLAADNMAKLNIDSIDYAEVVSTQTNNIPVPQAQNKWLDTLK